MKKLLFLFIAACGGLLISSCNNKTAKGTTKTGVDQHTSANSLDWNGTYKGTVPCADCEGIATELILKRDNTYTLKTQYLGKDDAVQDEQGSFSWNKEGNAITLANLKGKPNQYRVGENGITQLDMSGNKIMGAFSEKYVLTKQPFMDTAKKSNAALLETYWKLTELMGKPVSSPPGTRELHIILKKQENRIQGFAGCNSIMGSFELKEGNFITFKEVASTRMACADMSIENQFKEILGSVDNYSILEDKLSLNKARMAPFARFEAVYH